MDGVVVPSLLQLDLLGSRSLSSFDITEILQREFRCQLDEINRFLVRLPFRPRPYVRPTSWVLWAGEGTLTDLSLGLTSTVDTVSHKGTSATATGGSASGIYRCGECFSVSCYQGPVS